MMKVLRIMKVLKTMNVLKIPRCSSVFGLGSQGFMPHKRSINTGAMSTFVKAGLLTSDDDLKSYKDKLYSDDSAFTLADVVNTCDPTLWTMMKDFYNEILEMVCVRMSDHGIFYGSLDPSLIKVIDGRPVLPMGFVSGPRHMSLIQQLKSLGVFLFSGYTAMHFFEAVEHDHFMAELKSANTLYDMLMLTIQPFGLSELRGAAFALSLLNMLKYSRNFPSLRGFSKKDIQECAATQFRRWDVALDSYFSRTVNLQEDVGYAMNWCPKDVNADVFESVYDCGGGGVRFDDTCYKSTILYYYNAIRHCNFGNRGKYIFVLRSLHHAFPYILVDLCRLVTAYHKTFAYPVCEWDVVFKSKALSFIDYDWSYDCTVTNLEARTIDISRLPENQYVRREDFEDTDMMAAYGMNDHLMNTVRDTWIC